MSLDKAINSGKEKRKPYRGAKAVDCTCRNHGSCSYCLNNRMHSTKRQYGKTEDQEQEYIDMRIGAGDPTDVDMDYAGTLMERFGFDPDDSHDMVRSGMWWNPKIEEELKMKAPKFYSALLPKEHVDGMARALRKAGLRLVVDRSAGTVEAFNGTSSVFQAIQKGHNQPWIVRHIENLFS